MIEKDKVHILKLVFVVSLLVAIYFASLYNFSYKIHRFNSVFLILFILILLAPLIFYISRKNYSATAVCQFISVASAVAFFIYTAGGINAPGIFWLTVIPVTGSALFNQRGAIAGLGATVIILLFYLYIQGDPNAPNIIRELGIYQQEKIINIFLYIGVVYGFVYFASKKDKENFIKLSKKNKKINTLLQVIVHDTINPLSLIKYRCISLHKAVAAKNQGKVSDILLTVDRIVNQLKQLKSISAMEGDKVVFKTSTVDLGQVIEDAIKNLIDKISVKKIKINNSIAVKKYFIRVDENIFQNQIITNILTNAIKFSKKNSIINIQIEDQPLQGHIVFSIKDHGIGIPSQILGNIFFTEAATSRRGTNGEEGTGYGMPIVKEFTERLGGSIKIKSLPEEEYSHEHGTQVFLTFPKKKYKGP